MSLIESLHQARKARLQRIAARAVAQAGPACASSAVGPAGVARRDPAPRRRIDPEYERAWAFEILGVVCRDDCSPSKLKVEHIQRAVARHFGVQGKDFLSRRRARAVARPRQVAMYLAKVLTTKSYPEIGRCFGGRDHTSVLYAVRRIERLLTRDAELAAGIDRIREALEENRSAVWISYDVLEDGKEKK